jgi:hypothetical protein
MIETFRRESASRAALCYLYAGDFIGFPRSSTEFKFPTAIVTVLEDIKPGSRLRGLDPSGVAEVVQVTGFGLDALNVVFRADGRVGERLVMRGEEAGFEFVEAGRTYAFDADGGLLRLASEAYRIRLGYLFDPYIAVTASQIEALPHQITAVYGEMLPRQPLRFLLADGRQPSSESRAADRSARPA